jgi:FlaA1/EpsC-like NDP-sugar epimerase
VIDLAKAMCPNCKLKEVGIREGEKLHEAMITEEDARNTYEYKDHYIIYPQFKTWSLKIKKGGKKVPEGFRYSSDKNDKWLSVEQLKNLLRKIDVVY